MRPPAPLALLCSLAAFFLASTSRAEDGPRFRGGVFLQGAAYVVPGHGADAGPGVGGQMGVQIDDAWAVYAAPEINLLFRDCCGVLGGAVMVEHTWDDAVALGIGPAAAITVSTIVDDELGWEQFGGHARVAWYPLRTLVHEETPDADHRRKALTLALEARAYGSPGMEIAIVTPLLQVGYTAY